MDLLENPTIRKTKFGFKQISTVTKKNASYLMTDKRRYYFFTTNVLLSFTATNRLYR